MRADNAEDQDQLKAQDGILPFASDGRASHGLRKAFEMASAVQGMSLSVLNLSMYALRVEEVCEVLYAIKSSRGEEKDGALVGLTVSILLEEGWFERLVDGVGESGLGIGLKSVEIVGVPVVESPDVKSDVSEAEMQMGKLLIGEEGDVEKLGRCCSELVRFEMSLLKARGVESVLWEKRDGSWTKQEV